MDNNESLNLDRAFVEALNLSHIGDLFADLVVEKNKKNEFCVSFPKDFYKSNRERCKKYLGGLAKAAVREHLSVRFAAGYLIVTPKTRDESWSAQENLDFYKS